MHKERKDKHFIKKPVYPGGRKAMSAFIAKHLQYPEQARAEQVEGTVYLKYTINHKGKVVYTKVISSLGHGCDEEAERVVRLLEFQVPKTRGVKVLYHKNIQVHFRYRAEEKKPKVKATNEQPVIQYQLVAPKKTAPPPADKQKGYSYTIRIDPQE